MDEATARGLVAAERARLERLRGGERDEPARGQGDEGDDAGRRVSMEEGRAVDELLEDRWAALLRAEARLAGGIFGRSVRSGQPIPDERLEADPLAELTVIEAATAARGRRGSEHDVVVGSVRRPFGVLDEPDTTMEEEQAGEGISDDAPPEHSVGMRVDPPASAS